MSTSGYMKNRIIKKKKEDLTRLKARIDKTYSKLRAYIEKIKELESERRRMLKVGDEPKDSYSNDEALVNGLVNFLFCKTREELLEKLDQNLVAVGVDINTTKPMHWTIELNLLVPQGDIEFTEKNLVLDCQVPTGWEKKQESKQVTRFTGMLHDHDV